MPISITLNSVAETLDLFSMSENVSTYILNGEHTGDTPRVVMFKRKIGTGSTPDKLEVKVVFGEVDANGVPLEQNMIGGFNLSLPDGYDAAVKTRFLEMIEVLAGHAVSANFTSTQAIPLS